MTLSFPKTLLSLPLDHSFKLNDVAPWHGVFPQQRTFSAESDRHSDRWLAWDGAPCRALSGPGK